MNRCFAFLVYLGIATTAHAQQKAFKIPSANLKQDIIWDTAVDIGDQWTLGFGGQDQRGDKPTPRTRLKRGDGTWQTLAETSKPASSLAKEHASCQELARSHQELAARLRAFHFQGRLKDADVRIGLAELAHLMDKTTRQVAILTDTLSSSSAARTPYELGQARWVVAKLKTLASLSKESPAHLLGADKLAEAIKAITHDQVILEQAAEALDNEPPARYLAGLAHDAKTNLVVLFGGDHGDDITNDLWLFDPKTQRWEQRHPAVAPAPRGSPTLKANGDGTVTLTGGYGYTSSTSYCGSQYKQLDDGPWAYDISANSWSGSGTLGTADGRVYRTGPFHPDFFLQGAPPEAAAITEDLRAMPANKWVEMKAPQRPELCRTWGHAVLDPDGDRILVFSGGHSAHGGTDVLHYHLATNRWELPTPVEFPLGQLYSNTEYPRGFNINRRPWVTGHTYQSYNYDPGTKRMYFVGQSPNCFIYDPALGDWTGRFNLPKPMQTGDAYYTSQLVPTPSGLLCWTGNGAVLRLDADAKEWRDLPRTGSRLPGSVVDASTYVHDAKRDRLLFFRTSYGKPYSGETHAMDLKTGAVNTLKPANTAAVTALNLRESDRAVYDPKSDTMIFSTVFPDPADKSHRTLAFDCSQDRWTSLAIAMEQGPKEKRPRSPRGPGHSCGMMFDAKRGILWGVDTHDLRVYVLRLDPKTADARPLVE